MHGPSAETTTTPATTPPFLAPCLDVQAELTEWGVRHAAATADNDASHGRFADLVGARITGDRVAAVPMSPRAD